MSIFIKFLFSWLFGLIWKLVWKKPINWGSKIKALFPIIASVITRRQKRKEATNTDTPDTMTPEPNDTTKRPGWRLRRLFKRFR